MCHALFTLKTHGVFITHDFMVGNSSAYKINQYMHKRSSSQDTRYKNEGHTKRLLDVELERNSAFIYKSAALCCALGFLVGNFTEVTRGYFLR